MKSLSSLIQKELDSDSRKVNQELNSYYKKIKERFDEGDVSMNLGDRILLYREIKFLDAFLKKGDKGDIKEVFSLE